MYILVISKTSTDWALGLGLGTRFEIITKASLSLRVDRSVAENASYSTSFLLHTVEHQRRLFTHSRYCLPEVGVKDSAIALQEGH